MENTPFLETSRLILRRFTEQDVQALFELLKDPVVNRFLPWFPYASLSQTQQHLQSFYLESYQAPFGCRYAVCRKQDNRPIGYVHLSREENHDFGYALHREYWGQGLIAEAGQAILAFLKQAGLPYITATHDVNNPASGRVMQKLGLRYCYSYVEQWQPKDLRVTFRMYQLNLDGKSDRVYRHYWETSSEHFIEQTMGL